MPCARRPRAARELDAQSLVLRTTARRGFLGSKMRVFQFGPIAWGVGPAARSFSHVAAITEFSKSELRGPPAGGCASYTPNIYLRPHILSHYAQRCNRTYWANFRPGPQGGSSRTEFIPLPCVFPQNGMNSVLRRQRSSRPCSCPGVDLQKEPIGAKLALAGLGLITPAR
jgi:hypothetical protein